MPHLTTVNNNIELAQVTNRVNMTSLSAPTCMCMLKHHCYCPVLMRITKTAVCLQTNAILYHPYGFQLVF